jgi:methylated-DNA-protein-cysteine methyltransferase related protein
MSSVYSEIYQIIQRIPKGRVLTYGLISQMIGGRMSAQGVGWALKALGRTKKSEAKSKEKVLYTSDNVPWQRVVNAEGGTSTHKVAELPPGLQQHLLELEGVVFDEQGKLNLNEYLWVEGLAES